jgi:hypothetical protein
MRLGVKKFAACPKMHPEGGRVKFPKKNDLHPKLPANLQHCNISVEVCKGSLFYNQTQAFLLDILWIEQIA